MFSQEKISSPESEPDIKKRLENFQRTLQQFINMSPVVKGRFGEELFSGDAASLYTLLIDQKGTPHLVKVGWGEFSKNTFTDEPKELADRWAWSGKEGTPLYERALSDIHKMRNLPFPLFVVRQYDSYFANKSLQEKMQNNPVEYIKENAIMMYYQGNFTGGTYGQGENRSKSSFVSPLTQELPTLSIEDAEIFVKNRLTQDA